MCPSYVVFRRNVFRKFYLLNYKKLGFVKNRFIFYLAINFSMWIICCYEVVSIKNHVIILWFAPILLFSVFADSYFQGVT